MKLTDRQKTLNTQDSANLNQHRAQRPGMLSLPDAVTEMEKGNLPDTFYDHIFDRAYVRLLDKNRQPSGVYKALDMVDPDPNNRKFRTVED